MQQPFDALDAMLQTPAPTMNRDDRPMLIESLPHQQQQQAQDLAATIDIYDFDKVLHYGSDAQLALSRFSNHLLAQVQRKEQIGVSTILEQLTAKLEEINPQHLHKPSGNFLTKLFKKPAPSTQHLMSKYTRISFQIDRLSIQLERSKLELMRDLDLLDTLFEQNKQYFDMLNLYIAAAEVKRLDVLYEELPKLQEYVNVSEDPMAQQQLVDCHSAIERFERRIYDLEMARMMTIQSAPQIRLIQETSRTLADKIQSSIQTAIPVWKTQISLALTLNEQQKRVRQQQQLDHVGNLLDTKNAQMVELAQHDDVYDTHQQLLNNIRETMQIEQTQLQSKQHMQQLAHDTDETFSRIAKRQQK